MIGIDFLFPFKLLPSVSRLVTNVQALRFATPVIKKIKHEIRLESKKRLDNSVKKLPFKNEIALKNIFFKYEKTEKEVLRNINLNIFAGQSIGIIGPSGSGKSTLVDLILGLLSPNRGEISIDGKEITSEDIKSWQKNIGYVSQSIFILDDTFRKNIAFGVSEKEINDERIKDAIKFSQLGELINELPNGVDSFVGEAGVRISGGQRQRIGIARALYNNPSILVFDEATSALDNETEKSVMNSITSLQGNKTIIIIAHRLTTVKDCDTIIQLEKGSIVKKGKPKDLL